MTARPTLTNGEGTAREKSRKKEKRQIRGSSGSITHARSQEERFWREISETGIDESLLLTILEFPFDFASKSLTVWGEKQINKESRYSSGRISG